MSSTGDEGPNLPHLVFSYGTLRQAAVQNSLFGGPVPTTPDAVIGHSLVAVRITDPAVVELSGSDIHTGLVAVTDPDSSADPVEGGVLALDDEQLAAADAYESAYVRSPVPLLSGRVAWAYLPAPSTSRSSAGTGPGRSHDSEPGGVPRRVAVVVSGLGSVGTAFLRLLDQRAHELAAQHGMRMSVVAVVDSRGAAVAPDGLDLAEILAVKARGASVGELSGSGVVGVGVEQVLPELEARGSQADVLIEAGPADLRDGGAGLAAVLAARRWGLGVVLANKAPLVVAWDEVTGDADLGEGAGGRAASVRYSACVGAALPTVDLARSVLVSATPTRIEMVLNSTCQQVLGEVEAGATVEEAIARAQTAGLAEADPSFDLDGVDTAVKLVILTAALGHQVPLDAVRVTGIRGVTPRRAQQARQQGRALVLLGTAEPPERPADPWQLVVEPVALTAGHPLARMDRHETGVVVHTDVAGRIAASGLHRDVTATGAAVLRDVVLVAEALLLQGASR